MFSEQQLEIFFRYARERYQIMLDKESGKPAPWSIDPIFNSFRFCNVFREDDKVTKWFRNNVRNPMRDDPEVLFATMLFRWFNRIETGERLMDDTNDVRFTLFFDLNVKEVRKRLNGVSPVVTAAYIIRSPFGMNKLDGILCALEKCYPEIVKLQNEMKERQFTLEETHQRIASWWMMGDFMAYEIVTDLRHARLLQDAPDIMTWANPGPGAARGLDRLLGQEVGTFNRGNKAHRASMNGLMRELLRLSNNPKNWPATWPKWEMREVEHTLCEVDKYLRAKEGQGRPKQKYNP